MADSYERLPDELRKALKRCDLLVGNEILEYYYNLYDPKTGGFYYSISSRDLEKMTPFAEGTRFVLESLAAGGIGIPDWEKEKVGKWIYEHQDEDDGYFYEELWGKTTSGPRKDRDLTYSVDILRKYCSMDTKYPIPEERITSDIKNAAVPEYLKSKENIVAYMDSLDWSTESIWLTGQKLCSALSLIRAAGLFDTVSDYVASRQNPSTGLWGEDCAWMNTNGGMKLSVFFRDTDHPYPRIETMIDSVLSIFAGNVPAPHATYIWNPFVLLGAALSSMDDERKILMREKLLDKGADIVNFAVDSALRLKRQDGGFSSNIDRAQSKQQGFFFGLGLPDESDMDGTVIAGHRLRSTIHSVFGVKCSNDYYAAQEELFWERCKNKPEIIKTKKL